MHDTFKAILKPLATAAAACAVILAARAEPVPAPAAAPIVPALIPLPAHMVPGQGSFTLSAATPLVFDKTDADTARVAGMFAGLVHRARGIALAASTGPGAITLRRLSDPNATGKEGYSLEVTPDGVTISASQTAGLLYGVMTLWQLTTQTAGQVPSVTIAAIKIDDAPRFAWRGVLLDSVRHFQSVAFIKSFLDEMAREKLNVLQWHLTDDQGWRLQIKRYPRLTQIGAWRVPAGEAARRDIDPKTKKPRLYGGFYTQDAVRDIVAYAAQRNIAIVPEIEMPGHALAAIVAYPALGSVKTPPRDVSSDWGVFPYLYNPSDKTLAFLQNVLTETMALFPSAYIHVGGDEAIKDQWKASAAVQARMRALHIANEDALQSWFITRIGTFLKKHGRKLIGWDEILQGGMPPDATITSWRGVGGAVTAAKAGHDTVLSPAPILYFDNRQKEGPDEPSGRGMIVSLANVYDFDPAPASLSDDERKHILGVQADIWTEHIREEKNVAYAAFPRLAALSELAWSPAASHDRASFLGRIAVQLDRYATLDVPHGTLDAPLPPQGLVRDSHELTLCSNAVSLSVEGQAPIVGKRPTFLHDILNPCWIYPKVPMDGAVAIVASAALLPFNFQVGVDAQKVPLPKPTTPNGELLVHLDSCDSAPIATMPMPDPEYDVASERVQGKIKPVSGVHDLCFTFTRAKLDPYWALHTVFVIAPPPRPAPAPKP
ncbi:MAG TPA: family 20 glycosylhydrolase [Rhizomicrobium sp.]|jgi:hexosaminidase|nr:family 20 glycosylhydrolase [Rhizomicrobium sp.]